MGMYEKNRSVNWDKFSKGADVNWSSPLKMTLPAIHRIRKYPDRWLSVIFLKNGLSIYSPISMYINQR